MIQHVIEQHYGMKSIHIEPLSSHESSTVHKISTVDGTFVLKSHRTKHISDIEFDCLTVLSGALLSPEPVKTSYGTASVSVDDSCYILMRFVDNDAVVKSDMDIFSLGGAVNALHNQLKHVTVTSFQDRFDETGMIASITDSELRHEMQRCFTAHNHFYESDDALIHGDLGSWNILYSHNQIQFIDFQDIRIGSPYFDLAGIIDSYHLNDTETATLLNGYGAPQNEIHTKLKQAQNKWQFRGLIYMASHELISKAQTLNMLKLIYKN